MTSISIALTTYNGAAFLPAQLDSLLAQDRPPDEIVVCDDGSTDATLAVLARYAAAAPFPIRIHRNPANLGYRANFIQAASRCTSDLIFFCDQDDVWSPRKLATMAACFDDPAVLLAYHNATVTDAAGTPLDTLMDPATQAALLAAQPMPPWHYSLGFTQALRRSLLAYDDLWPQSRDHDRDAPMAHDQWYFFLALLLGEVRFVETPLVDYRQHGAQAYGAGTRSSGLFARLSAKLARAPGWDARAAAAADARADIIAAILPRLTDAQQPRARDIERHYRAFADRLRRRSAIYTAPSIPQRLTALLRSARHGDYAAPSPWTFDRRALPRDLLLGALAGPK